jgi:hypothetical protein
VSRVALRAPLLALGALLACCLLASSLGDARAATVTFRNLVLHAVGGFQPQSLPRHDYAPISFQGEVDLSTRDGAGRPPALTEAVIDFDRDGRLQVAGLPTCAAEQVAGIGTAEARAACGAAIVGEGVVAAAIETTPGAAIPLEAPLTIFNGPEEAGHPTAVLHASFGAPANQVLAFPVPIERIPGPFRYRVTLRIPPIAGGLGSLTRIQVEVGRRYSAGGKSRSYVSARCSDSVIRTRGRFTFADGTIIDGSVEKFCRAK